MDWEPDPDDALIASADILKDMIEDVTMVFSEMAEKDVHVILSLGKDSVIVSAGGADVLSTGKADAQAMAPDILTAMESVSAQMAEKFPEGYARILEKLEMEEAEDTIGETKGNA